MRKLTARRCCRKRISGQKTPGAILLQNISDDLSVVTRQAPPVPSWNTDQFHLPLARPGVMQLPWLSARKRPWKKVCHQV